MVDRKPISKKLRFEVFKRDFFKCQYCGSVPPSVVLEVDHLTPVFEGGKNNIDNLITACFDCNRGKGKRLLETLPSSTEEKSLILKEKIGQYKAFQKLTNELDRLMNLELKAINDIYNENFEEYYLKDKFLQTSVKRFIKDLGFEVVKDAMYYACNRVYHSDKVINYFCAICWNKIKGY